MPGSPKKRQRREVMEAGDAARAGFHQAGRDALAAARAERERTERERRESSGKTREQIRQEALERFWPMAEDVVARALRGEEVNREQLSAAFKVLEQQLGKPGQQQDDPNKDQPTAIIYESAALTPIVDAA